MQELKNLYRSSRPEVLGKKGVLRNFTKPTGTHLCQGLILNKVAGLWWLFSHIKQLCWLLLSNVLHYWHKDEKRRVIFYDVSTVKKPNQNIKSCNLNIRKFFSKNLRLNAFYSALFRIFFNSGLETNFFHNDFRDGMPLVFQKIKVVSLSTYFSSTCFAI